LICAENQPYNTVFQNCSHSDVCYKCTLSLRKLMNDDRCCICKVQSEKVIITCENPPKSFDECSTDKLIPIEEGFTGVLCDHLAIKEEVEDLVKLKCPVCGPNDPTHTFSTIHQLKSHTSKEHNLYFW